jgi:hypothetical protein
MMPENEIPVWVKELLECKGTGDRWSVIDRVDGSVLAQCRDEVIADRLVCSIIMYRALRTIVDLGYQCGMECEYLQGQHPVDIAKAALLIKQ